MWLLANDERRSAMTSPVALDADSFVTLSRASLILVVCLLGCGAPSAAPLVCATTGTKLAFGFQSMAAGRAPMATRVLGENGTVFLFVDDACSYWAYEETFDTPAGSWGDVRTGRLSADELASFNDEVLVAPWADLSDDAPLREHGAGFELWYGDEAFKCAGECDGDARAMADAAAAWSSRLYARGAAVDATPMRIEVFRYEGSRADYPFVEWTGATDLAALVRVPEAAAEVGDRALLDGVDASLLRSVREPFRSGIHGTFSFQFLPFSAGGELFSVYARQTIPYESPDGLIRGPLQ